MEHLDHKISAADGGLTCAVIFAAAVVEPYLTKQCPVNHIDGKVAAVVFELH